jgi:predicted nucleotidyltransferase
MILSEDFEDFIRLLNDFDVEYLVVGGYAMAFHGKPRYTGDLDIWINISAINADKLVNVINEFGFGGLGFSSKDFLKENLINQIGYPPLRIDVLTTIDGVSFEEAYKEKLEIDIDVDLKIKFISLSHLIQNKKASGRKIDIADIAELEKTLKKK